MTLLIFISPTPESVLLQKRNKLVDADLRCAVLRAMGYEPVLYYPGSFWKKSGAGELSLNSWYPERSLDDVRMVLDYCCKKFGTDVVGRHLWKAVYNSEFPSICGRYEYELFAILLTGATLTPEKIWAACVAVMKEAEIVPGRDCR